MIKPAYTISIKTFSRWGLIALLVLNFFESKAIAEITKNQQPESPNIIFIMLDDMDYYDVGIYGSPNVLTRTIDDFAKQGMRFDQYYTNGPVCSPTRASLVSGQYPARFGIKRAIADNSFRGIPGHITTLAEMLGDAGYRTAHIGKWHLGTNKHEFLPTSSGFDHAIRLVTENGLSYLDFVLSVDDSTTIRAAKGQHLTQVLTDHAIKFIKDIQTNHKGQPFFLNLWYLAPHRPLELPPDYDNSETKYCLDFDLKNLGCKTPRGNHAALVTNADRQIKRILDLLDGQKDLKDNTLVVITSDNGGSRETHRREIFPDRPLRGVKGSLYDGAVRVPMIARWPGVISENVINSSVVASFDFFRTFYELTGSLPASSNLSGESFLDVLQNNTLKIRSRPLFWENKYSNQPFTNTSGVFNAYAVRDGDWKMVVTPAVGPSRLDKISLFNLGDDPAEKNDLTARIENSLYDENFFNYRLKVFKKTTPESREIAEKYQTLVSHMQTSYFNWRRREGAIDYVPVLSETGIDQKDNVLNFSNGVASIKRNPRLDFNDGDFSFVTRLKPSDVKSRAIVAEKPGSWELSIEDDRLKLKLRGQANARETREEKIVSLQAPIEANNSYHVAFTVFGWIRGPSTVRLYLDGELVAESAGKDSVDAVSSNDEPGKPMIYIGNSKKSDAPFIGAMSLPRLSALSLYPSEVFWEFTRPLQPR
jgi:N-acetylgalactosamine-6-sulfatase